VKRKGKRILSRDARAAMAEVGRVNLARWKAEAPTRAIELQRDVDAFRAGLLRDAGPNLTTTKAGMIEAATTTYASILIVRRKLVHNRRADVAVLTERVSWLTSSLSRCLKTLDLGAKPKMPERYCLADLKPLETVEKGTV
jgi:hypothetical protein